MFSALSRPQDPRAHGRGLVVFPMSPMSVSKNPAIAAAVRGVHRERGRATATTSMRGAVMAVLFFASGPAGCGNDTDARGCIPGQSIECAGTHACKGHQVCASDGHG